MTGSTERELPGERLGSSWRAAAAARQDGALASGSTVVSCPAPFGKGGLGRHVQEIVDALARSGAPHERITEDAGLGGAARNARQRRAHAAARAAATLGRASAAWRIWAASVEFDARAAERLPAAEHLIAFNGTALRQLQIAPELGYRSRSLVAANSHFHHLLRQHRLAHRRHPLEGVWPRHLLRRNLEEYALADRIVVASTYVRNSFLQAGFAPERLALFPLTPDPRFAPATHAASPAASTFDVVYVGALTVHKGVPLLVEAFRQLPYDDIRLVLVGGWKARGMRRFLQRTCAEDPRVQVSPGDPLPRLRAAGLYAHAAYEDGFAYAPAEALACGVPVVVSEDTGMKDLIDDVGGGTIVPTGDQAALSEAIEATYRGERPGG